jgi:hypothetical protein
MFSSARMRKSIINPFVQESPSLLDLLLLESSSGYKTLATKYASLPSQIVYYGTDTTFSANANLGDAVADTTTLGVVVNGNLTIDSGVTITTAVRKRGMAILVKGDCNINGILSMTARGAIAAGQRVLVYSNSVASYEASAVGGLGGALVSAGGSGSKAMGNTGSTKIGTPSGGGSGAAAGGIGMTATSGKGGNGTSFSGGPGGGGSGRTGTAGAGSDSGGAGGTGQASGDTNWSSGGGAGNPGGASVGTSTPGVGGVGTGGLLILYVTGILTISATGQLLSEGTKGGGYGPTRSGGGGGGSGGGAIQLFCASLDNTGAISVAGGPGGVSGLTIGGPGGEGSIIQCLI